MTLSKKLFTALPIIALAASVAAPFNVYGQDIKASAPSVATEQKETKNPYSQMTGTVSLIIKNDYATFIRLKEGESETDFRISDKTVFVTREVIKPLTEIKEGDKLTAYYIMPLVNILIYPAQMPVTAFVKVDEAEPGSVMVNHFDENLTSSDNTLKLNLSEDTIIENTKGEKVTDVANKDLIVFYTVTTRSIPAQTTPQRIIVLGDESGETLISLQTETPNNTALPTESDLPKDTQTNTDQITELVKNAEIIVNGVTIKAPNAFVSENNIIMLPLRAVAEAAGHKVTWNAELGAVTVGLVTTLTVGKDYYTFAKMAPIELGQVPVIVDGVTYVPITFFFQVMQLDADLIDASIVVNVSSAE